MTEKEREFLKEVDMLEDPDDADMDLLVELYENFEPFKTEYEKDKNTGDEIWEFYYEVGGRIFFLRKIEYEGDFEFDYMAKFELDSEKFGHRKSFWLR